MSVRLDTDAALDTGLLALAALDPTMARLVAECGPPALRTREPGFAGLAAIVVGQQVSTASAAAILGRLRAAVQPLSAEGLSAATVEQLRGAGLSRPKVRTLRAAADAIRSGALPLADLPAMEAEAAQALLTAVPGIGPWTAEIYLMFCLGHPDAFAAGDLALQEAVRLAYRLDLRPDARELRVFAERWRPWRSVAALILWAFYRRAKSREGVLAAAA